MADLITAADLQLFNPKITDEQAAAYIADFTARAIDKAPCLAGVLTDQQVAAAKAILRDAILRRAATGTGAITTDSTNSGIYGHSVTVDTTRASTRPFYPSEIADLQAICGAVTQALPSGCFPCAEEAVPAQEWAHK